MQDLAIIRDLIEALVVVDLVASRPFFLSTGNLAHLGDAVASIRWHDAGG